jgi:hypothetical protein
VALAALFASGWFGRDLIYPSLTPGVHSGSATVDAQEAGGIVGLVTKTELDMRGWPWWTIGSVQVEGCLGATSVDWAQPPAEDPANGLAEGSAGTLGLCNVQPDAVYIAHTASPGDMAEPSTILVLSDSAPRVSLEFDTEPPAGSAAEPYTIQAPPARVASGDSAVLVMFWRIELPEETKVPGECWLAPAESGLDSWYCLWEEDQAEGTLQIAVELRSALGFVHTEWLDLMGMASEA